MAAPRDSVLLLNAHVPLPAGARHPLDAHAIAAQLGGADGEWTETAAGVRTRDWAVETKYYTAQLCMVTADHAADVPAALLARADAVVFAVDASLANPLGELSPMWLKYIDTHEPSVVLLVDARETVAPPEVQQRMREFAVEHQMEWIEMAADEEDGGDDAFGAEAFGLDRIREALHNHLWPVLQRKDAANASALPPVARDTQPAPPPLREPRMCGNETCLRLEQDGERFKVCSRCKQQFYCSPECQKTAWKAGHKAECTPAPVDTSGHAVEDMAGLLNALSRITDEKDEDAFDLFVEHSKRFRERGKDLPSDVRREYAEKIAMAFAQLLGEEQGDDDEAGETNQADADESPQTPAHE